MIAAVNPDALVDMTDPRLWIVAVTILTLTALAVAGAVRGHLNPKENEHG